MSAPESLRCTLERLVRREQADKRLPSIASAVVRDGEIVWEGAVGTADVDAGAAATIDTQYRIGSITKTLTATAIMQLRDAGDLELEDPLDRHLEGAAHAPSIRQLLSHSSGLQRETPGDVWATLKFLSDDELLRDLGTAERVLAPGERFHYSNLGFALLGRVVAAVSGLPYERYVEERIMHPLGLVRTSFRPQAPHAAGYLVEPYRHGVRAEQPVETASFTPSGQLWSTVEDLCRWAAFLADPDPAVLAAKTVEEMRTVQVIDDHTRWTAGYGLGLGLLRDGDRILAGHGGAMPGFIAGVYISPKDRIGAAALTNSGTARVGPLLQQLIAKTLESMPLDPEAWQLEDAPPAEIASALGRWWLEGSELVVHWRKGRLEATFSHAEEWEPPSIFERETHDLWRTVSGGERGEQLRIERDPAGQIVRMFWATYLLTRDAATFGSV
ncbi:MAG: serine hydrolase domain-containing protein [Gaiellaceae bacterium]